MLTWPVARNRGGTRVAIPAVVLMSLTPFAIRYGSEARMYSMLMFETLLGIFIVDQVLAGRRKWLIGLPIVSAALALTHYWGIWLVVMFVAVLACLWLGDRRVGSQRPWLRLAIATSIGGIAFVPWVGAFRYQAAHTGTPWAKAIFPSSGFPLAFADWAGGDHAEVAWINWIWLFLIVIGIFGVAANRTGISLRANADDVWKNLAIIGFGAMLFGLILARLADSAFQGRYAAPMFPIVMLLVAAGISKLPSALWRHGTVAVLVGLCLIGGLRIVREDRTQAGAVAAVLNAQFAPGDKIIFCPDQIGPSVTRLVNEPKSTFAFPVGNGEFVNWVDYAARNRVADAPAFAEHVLAAAEGHAVWFVDNPGYRTFEGKCDQIAATLTAARPNAQLLVTPNDAVFEFFGLTRFAP